MGVNMTGEGVSITGMSTMFTLVAELLFFLLFFTFIHCLRRVATSIPV